MSKQPLDLDLFNLVQQEDVFEIMQRVKEDSPYHREDNVLVHTHMVCTWYINNMDTERSDFFLGLFACLFHDVAKPCCRVRKENKERGVYFGYDRHDMVGAEMTEAILVKYNVSEFDIYIIKWMIEHHQIFWGTKSQLIRRRMVKALIGGDFYVAYKYFMLADNYGRLTDKPPEDGWQAFAEFENFNWGVI